ncbi:MAG: ATP-dependent DNA helicase, partial [Puniceicoccaceae bacterium]
HTVPAVASDHFGAKVTSYGLNRLLLGLFHPKRNTGLLKGIATEHTLQLVIDCLDAGELFFETLRSLHLAKQPIVRLREPFWTDPTLDDPLRQLAEAVGTTADRIDDEGRREQLADQRLRLRAVRDTLRRSLRLEPETDVHWLERQRGPRRVVEVRSAPIDVAPCLREHLFEAGSSIVLTSATLSIGGAMDHFAAQVGASDARTCIQDSPFPFRRHMRIYIAKDVPPPERGNPAPCQEAIADYLEFCLPRVEGGSLVLFTSFADLETAARRLAPFLERAGRPFSRQAPRTTTRELAAWLRDQRDGILFGTESFWTGIDIPGPALSQVVITRLPFEVPTHPLAEARADHCLARGGDPFRDLQLPDAVMRFRQGIGRLIRSREDRGLITILDSRILRKTYGRAFLAGLPHRNYTAIDRHSRDSHFQPFANPTPPPRPPPS